MKLIIIFAGLFLTACASLINGEANLQPVVVKDAKHKIMTTKCGGAVEDWGSCFKKAGKSCPQGYEILEKYETPVGPNREITFQCK